MSTKTLFYAFLFCMLFISVAHSENQQVLNKTFKVIHLRDPNGTEFSSLCIVDLLVKNLSLTYDVYYPFHYHLEDLCENIKSPDGIPISGFHSFKYSNQCSLNQQIENFVSVFFLNTKNGEKSVPNGILFSTPCNINITARFNISQHTNDLIQRYNFSIFVINQDKTKNLSVFNQIKQVHTHNSPSLSYIPMLIIFLIASFTVFIGSYWSGVVRYEIYMNSIKNFFPTNNISTDKSTSRPKQFNKNEQAFTNISIFSVFILVICMISALLLLYFFYKYLVYLILGLFLITSMTSMFICLEAFTQLLLPSKVTKTNFKVPPFLCCKEYSWKYFDLILILISILIPMIWFCIRHKPNAWILQDFLGFIFCINMLRTLRLPSLRICTYLLSILFIYDIFFVFITPLFTSKGHSIMVEVATGGNGSGNNYFEYRCEGTPVETLPMLFRVPRKLFGFDPYDFFDVCAPKSDSVLGYGDVMIPGLLMAYCSAFDRIKNIPYNLYFTVSMVSYCIGLVVTFEGAAQPALLYLVPCTLVPLLIISVIRKDFKSFWNGPEKHMINEQNIENN